VISAQDLEGSGITVNALPLGGATDTGMIPHGLPEEVVAALLTPDIVVPPLLWLVSAEADGITGWRLTANQWSFREPKLAVEDVGRRRSEGARQYT
jgi:hypothetical protein